MLAVSFTEGWFFFFSGTGTDEGQSAATLPSAVVKWKCSWEDRFWVMALLEATLSSR